jgi:3-methyladenine DNA glycosylase AlkD
MQKVKWTDVTDALSKIADKKKVKLLAGYFKTKKGEYGEGDVFLGVTVPEQRKIAKQFSDLAIAEIQKLLKSKIHEHRLTALIILVSQFRKADEKIRKKIFDFYLKNIKYINNWDLVDLSSHEIVGAYLLNKPRDVLHRLAESKNIWSRRIAVVSTYHFIYRKDFADTLAIAEKLLGDDHDLLHKAVGWMLREVGKRDQKVLRRFLDKHATKMPRTTLRYAIEKFPESDRKKYLVKHT